MPPHVPPRLAPSLATYLAAGGALLLAACASGGPSEPRRGPDAGPIGSGDDPNDRSSDAGSGGTGASDGGGGSEGEATNMLANASFEGGDASGCPEAWTCVTYRPADAGSFSVDDGETYAGTRAAMWSAADTAPATVIRQIHPASAGATYELDVSVKGDDLETAPYLQILFESASGEILASRRYEAEAGTSDWTRIAAASPEAPAETARVRFNLSTDGTDGTVWWDDAVMVETRPGGGDPGPSPIEGTDLCELGLSDGELINPYLEEHVTSGETVIVCRGTYELSSLHLSGDDWTLIAPQGATLAVSGGTVLSTEGTRYRVSGFIFDQTAAGARLSFNPAGDDWILDHLAWRGEHPGGAYLMTPSVDSPSATGLIDRVYMGDGQAEGTGSGAVWVNANRGHYGELTFRRVYIAHFIDNGLYASGPPTKGQPGKTHVEDSFFWSNTISNARTGSLSGPCFVTGSVFLLDDSTQACGEGCSNPGLRTTRAVWSWYGEVVVEDSDFTVEHGARLATSRDGTITESGNRVGAGARTTPPAGVPTSPDAIYEELVD